MEYEKDLAAAAAVPVPKPKRAVRIKKYLKRVYAHKMFYLMLLPAVVLLAGKGCEAAQKRKNGPEPCIPAGILARQALAKYDRDHGQ